MRDESWLLSDPDDSQRDVLIQPIDKNILVQGVAGSGKTNMAISRASIARTRGSYILVVFNVALKRWISYGLKKLNLDKENVVYSWAWDNTGMELDGQVYCEKNFSFSCIYLVNESSVRKFVFVARDRDYVKKNPKANVVGIHFDDYVEYKYYKGFGRRETWFRETAVEKNFKISNYDLIPRAVLYRPIVSPVDYIIIDEAQDMNAMDYLNKFRPMAKRSLTLFGDSNQRLYSNGSPMSVIGATLKRAGVSIIDKTLNYNYRLPKTIARVAQTVFTPAIDLITNNRKNGGNSDYPTYPKPTITHCKSKEDELNQIINTIQNEDLDDVAILVPTDQDVINVNNYLSQRGIATQVRYRAKIGDPNTAADQNDMTYRRIDTYNFANTDVPCVLTYISSKGTEFDNVFIPYAESDLLDTGLSKCFSLYVACTRSSYRLHISYTKTLTHYLSSAKKDDIEWLDTTSVVSSNNENLPF